VDTAGHPVTDEVVAYREKALDRSARPGRTPSQQLRAVGLATVRPDERVRASLLFSNGSSVSGRVVDELGAPLTDDRRRFTADSLPGAKRR